MKKLLLATTAIIALSASSAFANSTPVTSQATVTSIIQSVVSNGINSGAFGSGYVTPNYSFAIPPGNATALGQYFRSTNSIDVSPVTYGGKYTYDEVYAYMAHEFSHATTANQTLQEYEDDSTNATQEVAFGSAVEIDASDTAAQLMFYVGAQTGIGGYAGVQNFIDNYLGTSSPVEDIYHNLYDQFSDIGLLYPSQTFLEPEVVQQSQAASSITWVSAQSEDIPTVDMPVNTELDTNEVDKVDPMSYGLYQYDDSAAYNDYIDTSGGGGGPGCPKGQKCRTD